MTTDAEGTEGNTDEQRTEIDVTPGAEDGEIIVAIGTEPSLDSAADDELIDGQLAPQWAKDLRVKARDDARRIRELEAALAAKAVTPQQAPAAVVVGDKPTLEACDFDSDKFESEFTAWSERKAKAEQQERDATAAKTKADEAYATRLKAYTAGAAALKVSDFEVSEKLIETALSPMQQSIIVKLAKNSALFVYALGRDPAKLAELKAVTDPVEFAYQMAAIEKDIKTVQKSKFTLEKRPEAGGGGGRTAGTSAQLEAARKDAEKTGDYTQVRRIKQQMAEDARKAAAA